MSCKKISRNSSSGRYCIALSSNLNRLSMTRKVSLCYALRLIFDVIRASRVDGRVYALFKKTLCQDDTDFRKWPNIPCIYGRAGKLSWGLWATVVQYIGVTRRREGDYNCAVSVIQHQGHRLATSHIKSYRLLKRKLTGWYIARSMCPRYQFWADKDRKKFEVQVSRRERNA